MAIADPKPQNKASWSIFVILFGCALLYFLIKKWMAYKLQAAVQNLRKEKGTDDDEEERINA